MKTSPNKNGFTLAEILTVIGILLVIGMVALVGINPLQQFFKGYDTVKKSDLSKLKTAFEGYFEDHGCYPPQSVLSQCGSTILTPYLSVIPCDPNTKQPYSMYIGDNEDPECPQKYAIYAKLTNAKDPKGDDIKYCPDTISTNSPSMTYVETVKGCSSQVICQTLYGCKSGTCEVISEDAGPTCGPNYCSPSCNNVDCSKKNRRGAYIYECK